MALKQGEDGNREVFNALYRALGKPERRRILFRLLESNPNDGLFIPEDIHVGETELSQLHIELVHVHLPMLEEAGLIRWNRDAEHLSRGPNFADVGDVITAISEHDPVTLDG